MTRLQKITRFGTAVAVLLVAWSINPAPFNRQALLSGNFLVSVQAEDDEDEHEDERDDDEEEDDSDSPKQSTKKQKTIEVIREVIEYRPVTQTIMVTEEAYARDTDGDLLVDALDPDPLRSQSEYFTDIDGDGVPNALDQHHDEDDFAYYMPEIDGEILQILTPPQP